MSFFVWIHKYKHREKHGYLRATVISGRRLSQSDGYLKVTVISERTNIYQDIWVRPPHQEQTLNIPVVILSCNRISSQSADSIHQSAKHSTITWELNETAASSNCAEHPTSGYGQISAAIVWPNLCDRTVVTKTSHQRHDTNTQYTIIHSALQRRMEKSRSIHLWRA